ncbi:hypothetical protein [Ruegeria atlantica]|uniref:hypothetical protein n=1 Tax=Ruegeria atlantica TaxID=81569 RepID=UPI00147FDF53|nr:hypothetical protein [Ruegeria atlantica]
MRLPLSVLALIAAQSVSAEPAKCISVLHSEDGKISPFHHFEWLMMPAVAKRVCGGEFEADYAAIRRYYGDIHGCSPTSGIGSDIEAFLTHEPVDDLLFEFGVSDREAVPEEAWNNFCDASAKVQLSKILVSNHEEISDNEALITEVETQISDFVLAIEMMQAGER